MPTYDYKCPQCGQVFEKFHGINDKPAIDCPSCQVAAERQIGAGVGVHYKGTGFYTTDYKNSSSSASGGGCASGACGV